MARCNTAKFVAGEVSRSTWVSVAFGWGYFITSEGKGHGAPQCGALSSQLVTTELGSWRGPKESSHSLRTVLQFQDCFSIPRAFHLPLNREELKVGRGEGSGPSPLYYTTTGSGPRLTVREVLQTKGRVPHLN